MFFLASGPVVGNIWDLKGKPGNNSAYMEVSSNHGVSKGSTGGSSGINLKQLEEDHDYYLKTSGHDSKYQRNPNRMFILLLKLLTKDVFLVKMNWSYTKDGKVNYISTGFVGIFDKSGGNTSSYGNAAGTGSSYGNVGHGTGGKSSSPGNAAAGTGSSYGYLGHGTAGKHSNSGNPSSTSHGNFGHGTNGNVAGIPSSTGHHFGHGSGGRSPSPGNAAGTGSSYGMLGHSGYGSGSNTKLSKRKSSWFLNTKTEWCFSIWTCSWHCLGSQRQTRKQLGLYGSFKQSWSIIQRFNWWQQ